MMEPGPILSVERLCKAYRRRAVLTQVSFSVAAGESVAVIGPNGAGKSTLLGCIAGDRLPDSGSIRVCGADPFSDLPAAARCMGVIPEQPFLYGELTVSELLGFVLEVRRSWGQDCREEADRLLSLLGLGGAEGSLCRELSQGSARKVALAAALVHRPRLIVLDEAFNGLDRPSATRLVEELRARLALGAAVLVSSHDLELLADLCHRGLLFARSGAVEELAGADWERWRNSPSLERVRDHAPTES